MTTATANDKPRRKLVDIDAERSFVGSIIFDPSIADEAIRVVDAAAIHDPDCRAVFVAIGRLRQSGRPVDVVTVAPEIDGNGTKPEDLIAFCVEAVPTAAHWESYGRRVMDLHKQAQLAVALEDAQKSVRAGNVGGALAHLRSVVDDHDREPIAATGKDPDELEIHSPKLISLSAVEPCEVQWLWPGRIALGKLTLLAGDPGLGKSFLSLDLTARVSIGARWPDNFNTRAPRGGVVLLGAEDDIADTIRPRLDAMGADVSRVVALEAVKIGDNELTFNLARDIPALEKAISQTADCKLVVIDPISAYLGGTDSHNNADVRGLLMPLSALAAKYGVAVLAVTHLNKGAGGSALYRATGSLAFIAAARAAWLVAKDKDDPRRRLFLPAKNNLAGDTLGMAFQINEGVVEWEPDPVEITADEAMATETRQRGRPPEERDDATSFLRSALADGPRLGREVTEEAVEGHGIGKRTLDRARSSLGVESYRESSTGPWWWKLSPDCQLPDCQKPTTPELWHSGNLEKTRTKSLVLVPSESRLPKLNGHGTNANGELIEAADEGGAEWES